MVQKGRRSLGATAVGYSVCVASITAYGSMGLYCMVGERGVEDTDGRVGTAPGGVYCIYGTQYHTPHLQIVIGPRLYHS